MATWESRVTCAETYVSGGAENYSNVTITFQIRRLDYSMIGYNQAGSAHYSIACNGVNSGNKTLYFTWNAGAGVWWTVGSHSFKIPHNSDGSKTIYYSAYFYTAISPSEFAASGSKTLTKIPRYPNITSFNIDSTTQTSATISWKADSVCDAVQYTLNNGSWKSASGATFTINNLSPGTKYDLKISVRRKDSQLWKNSGVASFTTVPIATISTSPISFNIGQSLNLSFSNYNNNASFIRLYQKDVEGEWSKITEVTDIQASLYSWNLSSFANNMYQNTPNSNTSEIKLECGVALNNKEYINTYLGTAIVTDSNPIFSDFTFYNTDEKSTSMLGSTTEFLTYFGNLKADIITKATAKNYARILYYNVGVETGDTVIIKKIDESTESLSVLYDTFTTAGTYRISMEAVDSRGNMSNVVSKTFVVYLYHNPTATITAERINGFEKEISLTVTAFISRVLKANENKNTLNSLKYRYRESGGSWNEYKSITPTSANSENDIKISYANTSFISLPTNKSYEFEFVIQDKITPAPFTVSVGQGIPIMAVLDNGKVLIGEAPNDENLSKPNELIVGTDILARDTDGIQKAVFGELRNLIIPSVTEPSEQTIGGFWLKIEQ